MKQFTFILTVLMLHLNITLLNASEHIKINTEVFCIDPVEEILSIKINGKKFNLTQDAIQDNIGGYVDIPEDKHYLKTADKLYYLNGIIEANHKTNINQFKSLIDNNSNKFIGIDELYSLKKNKNLKFIQKIILDNGKITNSSYKTTTNILKIYFDEDLFTKEYEKCKNNIN